METAICLVLLLPSVILEVDTADHHKLAPDEASDLPPITLLFQHSDM